MPVPDVGAREGGPLSTALRTVAVAFSMFSAIPMPHVPWTPRTMRFALAAFPLVGLACGIAALAWCLVCAALRLPRTLFAAGLVACPVLLTGGIHLDGFADVEDARASRSTPERMLSIMDDPHIGSFAAIRTCSYLLLYFGLATALEPSPLTGTALACLYVMCRAASGLAVATFPIAKGSGLARTFSDASSRKGVAAVDSVLFVVAGACASLLAGAPGVGAAVAVLAAFACYRRCCIRLIGGTTGDFAGWFLQVAELAGLAAYVLAGHLVAGWAL